MCLFIDDCWAVALTRHYKTLLQLQNIVGRPFLTRDQLKRGVGPAHVVSGQGIDRVKHAIPFMKSIGCDMQVHNRPRGDDVREFEAFEEFILLLLKQGPVMVNIEYTPGFGDFCGEVNHFSFLFLQFIITYFILVVMFEIYFFREFIFQQTMTFTKEPSRNSLFTVCC